MLMYIRWNMAKKKKKYMLKNKKRTKNSKNE